MSTQTSDNNKRIAKNTIFLYIRMIFMVAVTLYTSRVILNALGVEDFGIYNAVGGLISIFSVLSASFTVSVSRFITYELGKGEKGNVSRVFSSAVNVQIGIMVLIFLVAESIGLWFLNTKMVFPEERAVAANYVYHFTIITFLINLFSIPYNAAIIAHEKMSAFAYISILDAVLRLVIAYSIVYTSYDRLIVYGLLMMLVSVVLRCIYGFYCKKHFEECTYHFILDRKILKDMFSYAGWTYIGAGAAIMRDHGGNILLNLFFGPTVNAARGISMQVQNAVNQFAQNFTTALNPQITKNFASGDFERVKFLIRAGTLGSYFLLLIIAIPAFFNTPYILKLWLKVVPDFTVVFVRLSLIFILSESISNALVTSASASGNIRNYQILVGGIQFLNFPVSYICLKLGFPSYSILVIAIVLSQCCLVARLYILRGMIGLSAIGFWKECYSKIVVVTVLSLLVPGIIQFYIPTNFIGLVISCLVWLISSLPIIYFVGCNKRERAFVKSKIKVLYCKYLKK